MKKSIYIPDDKWVEIEEYARLIRRSVSWVFVDGWDRCRRGVLEPDMASMSEKKEILETKRYKDASEEPMGQTEGDIAEEVSSISRSGAASAPHEPAVGRASDAFNQVSPNLKKKDMKGRKKGE